MIHVDVQLACDDPDVPGDAQIHEWIVAALGAASALNGRDLEISVRVVGADEMCQLNADHRKQDKPTNVLSFPAGDVDGLPDEEALPLGDIVICPSVLVAEAAAQDKALNDHWAHMIVHGTLHLLGYDHIEQSQAILMESLERVVLESLGIANPYRAL